MWMKSLLLILPLSLAAFAAEKLAQTKGLGGVEVYSCSLKTVKGHIDNQFRLQIPAASREQAVAEYLSQVASMGNIESSFQYLTFSDPLTIHYFFQSSDIQSDTVTEVTCK